MADYQAVPTGSSTQDSSRQPPVTATVVVYLLFGLAAIGGIVGHGMLVGAPLLTIIGVIAVIVCDQDPWHWKTKSIAAALRAPRARLRCRRPRPATRASR